MPNPQILSLRFTKSDEYELYLEHTYLYSCNVARLVVFSFNVFHLDNVFHNVIIGRNVVKIVFGINCDDMTIIAALWFFVIIIIILFHVELSFIQVYSVLAWPVLLYCFNMPLPCCCFMKSSGENSTTSSKGQFVHN